MTQESQNPYFRAKRFTTTDRAAGVMTAEGATEKAFLLIAVIGIVASLAWWATSASIIPPMALWICAIVGLIAGIGIAIALMFKPQWSPTLAPIYAICEGFVLGAISMVVEASYPGIVIQAVALTIGIALTMLALYRSGIIKVTRGFWIGVLIATAGVMLISLIAFALSLFHVTALADSLFGNGLWGIGFSLVVIVIATLNLCLDFEFIVQASKERFPQYYEWYAAFGLAVTLVWLYIEILRLLMKLRSRD